MATTAIHELASVLVPTTDRGVVAQLFLVAGLITIGLIATRRNHEIALFVIGLGVLATGLMGLRALH